MRVVGLGSRHVFECPGLSAEIYSESAGCLERDVAENAFAVLAPVRPQDDVAVNEGLVDRPRARTASEPLQRIQLERVPRLVPGRSERDPWPDSVDDGFRRPAAAAVVCHFEDIGTEVLRSEEVDEFLLVGAM